MQTIFVMAKCALGETYNVASAAVEGTDLEIEILGELKKATVIAESPFDPENTALRA